MSEPQKFELSPESKQFIEGLVLKAVSEITKMVLDQMAITQAQMGLVVNRVIAKEFGLEGPTAKRWEVPVVEVTGRDSSSCEEPK